MTRPAYRDVPAATRADRPVARAARRFRPGLDRLEERWVQTVTALTAGASPTILVHPPQRYQPRGVLNAPVVPVTIEGQVSVSGPVAPIVQFQVVDEYGRDQPGGLIPVQSIGPGNYLYTTRIALELSRRRNDPDGRHYTIFVTAADPDGAREASVVVMVPRSRLEPGIFAVARARRLGS